MKFLKSSVLFISMACIVPVCSIAREKRERITRAEIEQKSADEFINGLMSLSYLITQQVRWIYEDAS